MPHLPNTVRVIRGLRVQSLFWGFVKYSLLLVTIGGMSVVHELHDWYWVLACSIPSSVLIAVFEMLQNGMLAMSYKKELQMEADVTVKAEATAATG